eukprot:COSAG03_NODE_166_length_11291_cov_15.762866_5_plen_98_part_00
MARTWFDRSFASDASFTKFSADIVSFCSPHGRFSVLYEQMTGREESACRVLLPGGATRRRPLETTSNTCRAPEGLACGQSVLSAQGLNTQMDNSNRP